VALHYDGEIRINKLTLGWFEANCYIVTCPQTGESLIIDTPIEAPKILAEAGDKVRYIVITHAHGDHVGALREVQARTGAAVAAHPLDSPALPLAPNIALSDGDELRVGGVTMKVIHTPGHTPGSICLLSGKHLFSADTIFPHGPGRTGSPADLRQIIERITTKLFVLPDETLVYPGHGLDTVLGEEKKEYALFAARSHAPGLCGDVLWLDR